MLNSRYARILTAIALLLVSTCFLESSASAAPRDRIAPSAPGDLRVVSATAYQVALAWQPATDNWGVPSYRLRVSDGREFAVGQGTTSVRLSWGLSPDTSYSFSVVAIDGAGNRSRPSNVVSVTLPSDTTPPTVPLPSIVSVGTERVTLSFSAARDDGPYVSYQVLVNGRAVLTTGFVSEVTALGLSPSTTYVVAMRAGDRAGNWSLPSPDLQVTTAQVGSGDATPPSAPRSLAAFDDDCGDVFLVWQAALDDQDAAHELLYEVYVNGALEQTVLGREWAGFTLTEFGMTSFSVLAVDSSGNASAPAQATLNLVDCMP